MARAKSTARAEARRRHRAATAAALTEDPTLASQVATPRTNSRGAAPATPARGGIFGSFRAAVRPINLREDLLDLPRLATRTFAIWVPAVLVIGIFAVFEASGADMQSQNIQAIAFNLFVFPPPLAAAFLAGILTQRSSYLAGGVIGLISGLLFAAYVLTAALPTVSGVAVANDVRIQNATYALIVSPLTGLAVGGFAGFYRRFLRMANPNAGNRSSTRNSKSAARRR
ncbi:MAG: hypothetical protein ACRDGQ_13905 [Candidatus Limnocylindrales bacterium]